MVSAKKRGSRARTRDDRRGLLYSRVEESINGASDVEAARIRFVAECVLKRADDELLGRHPAESFYGHVTNAIETVRRRPKNQIMVGCSRPEHKTHGYDLPMFVLETCMADQPFIVDTIKMVLRRLDVRILGTLNMILPVKRNQDGSLVEIGPAAQSAPNESLTCHLLSSGTTTGREKEIEEAVHHHLTCAHAVVRDFRAMRRMVREVDGSLRFVAEGHPEHKETFDEVVALGDWLIEDNFVFMGGYRFDANFELTSQLGLGRIDTCTVETAPQTTMAPEAQLVSISQTRIDSPVHRDARLQEIIVRLHDHDGEPAGGVVFQGLFTYNAIIAAASMVPVLRMRLKRIVADEELVPRSHRMKLFVAFFNRLPLTYTFVASDIEIRTLINEAIDVDFGGVPRIHSYAYHDGNVAHAFVLVSRDRFGDKLRWQVQEVIAQAYGADHVEFLLLGGKTDAAMWHYLVSSNAGLIEPDIIAVNANVESIVRPWLERMRSLLIEQDVDEPQIDRWCMIYGDCLPDDYRQQVTADELLEDLRSFDRVHAGSKLELYLRSDKEPGVMRLVSHGPSDHALTDILPVIDNFGVHVQGEHTMPIVDAEGRTLYVESYRIPLAEAQGAHLPEMREEFIEAIEAALDGRMNSSTMNLLLLPGRLKWRQLQILRAYTGYGRQVGASFPPNLVQSVLHSNPAAVRLLLARFEARFAPMLDGKVVGARDDRRNALEEQSRQKFFNELMNVESAVEDRILRILENLISATLRTNYYQRPDDARGLSFKVRCADVEIMRDPRPMYEIYVYEPNVEGVHLRGGPVARGGLRWSDRPDDFRTEILGLMLTQMVKNTLIVPVGSKGGFVLKKPIPDASERRQRADELYEVFINGLLDVTDNIVDGEPVHPDDVVVHDGVDPYLVVAADKGTAHLSDTANRIATSRGFWLGDAFASGGSQGYDHKIYGITAKGAWVCVQRLFRELGVNTQKDAFTCVGIGDMSGDVFGNGMLLSKSMKVVGAFNHMHIFVDPHPNVAKSYAERDRLFKLPRSTWADYNKRILSAGGGVWDRGAKSIPLSPQIQQLLRTKADSMSGQNLVRALLKLDVDLLWNGGIGTYAKASFETDLDVGDKANDEVRVDATELRCRVIGEGGNLGFTHAARVEFSQRGGRITSDAVDNSGGVDLSDHEVNLKVLFAPLLESGQVDVETRNALLFEIDETVCADVLHNNYRHALGISVGEKLSKLTIGNWNTAIEFLAEELGIDRDLQDLPSRATLRERRNAGLALTRPEIARVVAFAKMWLFQEMMKDRTCSAQVARGYLDSYFPDQVRERFGAAVDGHKLAHEIICTVWCNELVDFAGALLLPNMAMEYERPVAELCNAYSLAVDVLGVREMRASLIALDGQLEAALQYNAYAEIERCVAATTWCLLALNEGDRLAATLNRAAELKAVAATLSTALSKGAIRKQRAALRGRAGKWQKMGLPRELARNLARLSEMVSVFAVAEVAERSGLTVAASASLWFTVAEQTGIGALISDGTAVPDSRWEAAANASLRMDLTGSMLQLSCAIAGRCDNGKVSTSVVRRALNNDLKLGDACELALQIPAERNPMAALVVLTNRLRARLPSAQEGTP
jgi:glutamate dehydrogenase